MNINKIMKVIAVVLLVTLASGFILAQNSNIKNKIFGQGDAYQSLPLFASNQAAGNDGLATQPQGGACGSGGCGCGGAAIAANVDPNTVDKQNAAAAQEANGAQEITVSFKNYGYYPNVMKFKKGVPVKMTMDLSTVQGCMRAVKIPALGVSKYVSEGDNVISFTPQKTGTFTMSCSMGMGRATIVVE